MQKRSAMSLPFNGGKGGHAEEIRIDFSKELKEDVVFWEEYAVIAKIIGLNWPRKEIRNWVECNWGKRISEELWEKIGRTLGTLLETNFDDVEDICKCARMRIAAVKKIPERITLVSEHGEWSQKVEIDKEISRCPRCGSKFHGEKDCMMFIRKANKTHEKARIERETSQKDNECDSEIRKNILESAAMEDSENKKKEINGGTIKGNINGSSINTEEDYRDSTIKVKGLSDSEFEYERGSDDEPYLIDELENIDPRSISQSTNVLLGKTKGEAKGSMGAMVVLWNPDKVAVDLIYKQENWMHCKVRFLQEDMEFSLFNVYGSTKTEEKKRVWIEITDQIRMIDSEKAIVAGDFNALLNNEEKFGAHDTFRSLSSTVELHNTIDKGEREF
ncbi:hypothetical protein SUGI_0088580 [Cryptomeria japonica]|nr:hypothetical protein SUGI_0088580 [Cryptomeria japonica]